MTTRPVSMAGAEPLKALKSKMQSLRNELEDCRDRSEIAEKQTQDERRQREQAEDVAKAQTGRLALLEDELDRTQVKLEEALGKLEEATKTADESERSRQGLENRNFLDEGRMEKLEQSLKQMELIAHEAETKYEEAARKLCVTEANFERSEDLLDNCQRRIKEMEEEQISLGQQARSYECDTMKASQREDSYEETIRDLTQRLKDKEYRLEESDRENARFRADNDTMERRYDELLNNYDGIKAELEATFADINDM